MKLEIDGIVLSNDDERRGYEAKKNGSDRWWGNRSFRTGWDIRCCVEYRDSCRAAGEEPK